MDIVFASVLLASVLLFWGAVIAWRWHSTFQFSKQVFVARRRSGEVKAHVNETDFVEAYMRSEGPRAATYIFVCAVSSAILVPLGMISFSVAWQMCWELTGANEVFQRGTMVHIFAMMLAGMATMILISMFGMRHFHSNVPVRLSKAIKGLNCSKSD